MRLLIDGQSLRVAQLGPDYLILEEKSDHPPGAAEFVFNVDTSTRSWRVQLPSGICKDSHQVPMAAIAAQSKGPV